jgi:hypothetical protein
MAIKTDIYQVSERIDGWQCIGCRNVYRTQEDGINCENSHELKSIEHELSTIPAEIAVKEDDIYYLNERRIKLEKRLKELKGGGNVQKI